MYTRRQHFKSPEPSILRIQAGRSCPPKGEAGHTLGSTRGLSTGSLTRSHLSREFCLLSGALVFLPEGHPAETARQMEQLRVRGSQPTGTRSKTLQSIRTLPRSHRRPSSKREADWICSAGRGADSSFAEVL